MFNKQEAAEHKILTQSSDGAVFQSISMFSGVVMEAIYTDSKDISSLLVYGNMFIVADIKDKAIKVADIYTGATSTLVHDLDNPTTVTLHHPDDVNGMIILIAPSNCFFPFRYSLIQYYIN